MIFSLSPNGTMIPAASLKDNPSKKLVRSDRIPGMIYPAGHFPYSHIIRPLIPMKNIPRVNLLCHVIQTFVIPVG